jgi:hypothetical protein
MSESISLDPLRSHPAFVVADLLAQHVGVERDLILFAEFVSLAAGRMVLPINIEIHTDEWAADLFIANRILDLLPDHVVRIETYKQFVSLERNGFENCAAVLIRGKEPSIFRECSEYTARLVGSECRQPSLWRVSDRSLALPAVASGLRLMTGQAVRNLDGFGHACACRNRSTPEGASLRSLLLQLPEQCDYPCQFRDRY